MKASIIILLFFLVTFIPFGVSPKVISLVDPYRNEGRVAFVVNESELSDIKNNKEDQEKTECKCGGTGVLTHGDGQKTPCPCKGTGECKCGKPSPEPSPKPSPDLVKSRKRILYFTADWCGPCQAFKRMELPKLEKAGLPSSWLNDKKETSIEMIDIDNDVELFNKYRGNRASIPLLILLDENDKEVSYLVGQYPAQKVLEMWNAIK